MKDKQRINLTKEKKGEMVSAIKEYFLTEREEEFGDLASGLLLDFIIESLAPAFYNQGIYDAYRYMSERNEDLLALTIAEKRE